MEPRVIESRASTLVVPNGYAEHAPPPDLAPYVACFWSRLASNPVEATTVHRVLPDGCVDIVLAFGAAGAANDDLSNAMGVGPMTKPMLVRGPQPRLYLGVRFKPGCAFVALGVPASELADTQVAYGVLSRTPSRDLEPIAAASSDDLRLATMVGVVRERLQTGRAVPRSVRAAVRAIVDARGDLRIASLASDIGITRQQLARQFAIHVGVTPKMLARVMRAHAALARADAARAAHPRDLDWSAIAQDLGYYDQSHLIDDFKALTGSTPGEWIP